MSQYLILILHFSNALCKFSLSLVKTHDIVSSHHRIYNVYKIIDWSEYFNCELENFWFFYSASLYCSMGNIEIYISDLEVMDPGFSWE